MVLFELQLSHHNTDTSNKGNHMRAIIQIKTCELASMIYFDLNLASILFPPFSRALGGVIALGRIIALLVALNL